VEPPLPEVDLILPCCQRGKTHPKQDGPQVGPCDRREFSPSNFHTPDCIWIWCPWAPEGTNVRKVDSVKQRQDVTHAPLIHGTPDAAFIYPLARDANAQVPLAVGLSVRHYSELSDVEHVFLCRGLMPRRYRCARLEEAHSNRRPRKLRRATAFPHNGRNPRQGTPPAA